jgi:hypothetical protein
VVVRQLSGLNLALEACGGARGKGVLLMHALCRGDARCGAGRWPRADGQPADGGKGGGSGARSIAVHNTVWLRASGSPHTG